MQKVLRVLFCLVLMLAFAFAGDTPERKTIARTEPEYPALAASSDIHGTVKLKLWIAPDGTVRRVEYVGGHPVLAETSVAAVKKWKYESASKETTAMVEFKF